MNNQQTHIDENILAKYLLVKCLHNNDSAIVGVGSKTGEIPINHLSKQQFVKWDVVSVQNKNNGVLTFLLKGELKGKEMVEYFTFNNGVDYD